MSFDPPPIHDFDDLATSYTVVNKNPHHLARVLRSLATELEVGHLVHDGGGFIVDARPDGTVSIRGDLTLKPTTATPSPTEALVEAMETHGLQLDPAKVERVKTEGLRVVRRPTTATPNPTSSLASTPNAQLYMKAVSRYILKDGRVLYHGDNPVTFVNTPKGQAGLKSRPWVIDHPDLHGKLWRVKAIECYCMHEIEAGRPIGVIVEPWE